jgi:hypothetical protein
VRRARRGKASCGPAAAALHTVVAFTAAFAAAALVLLAPRDARADLPAEPPRRLTKDDTPALPPPPSNLPHLAHGGADASLDGLVTTARSASGDASIGLLLASAEAPFGALQRLYLGGRLPLAAAVTRSGAGTRSVAGNLELGARVVFPMPAWLAFGGGLGFVLPTARFDHDSPAEEAAALAASLEPTEIALLAPKAIGVRPTIDLRLLRGPIVVQLRDGVDMVFDTGRRWQLGAAGRLVAHVGAVLLERFELSLEASQIYFFTKGDLFGVDVSDGKRTALTFGPFARVGLGAVDLGVGAVGNIQSPLATGIDRFVALRIALMVHPF